MLNDKIEMKILLNAVAGITTGNGNRVEDVSKTLQATVVGTGAIAATVVFEGSNDMIGWVELATVELSGNNVASDGFAHEAPWYAVRARLTSITGTDAAVTATVAS